MMKRVKVRATSPILTLLLVSALLVGCNSGAVKIGWSESSDLNHTSAHYASFDGIEQKSLFVATEGQTMTFSYDVTVEKGTLALEIIDPDGESLWEQTFQEGAANTVALTAPKEGRYTVRIEGKSTGGSFDLSWTLDQAD